MQKGWRVVPMARPLLPLVEDIIDIVLCQIHAVIIQEVLLEVGLETASKPISWIIIIEVLKTRKRLKNVSYMQLLKF